MKLLFYLTNCLNNLLWLKLHEILDFRQVKGFWNRFGSLMCWIWTVFALRICWFKIKKNIKVFDVCECYNESSPIVIEMIKKCWAVVKLKWMGHISRKETTYLPTIGYHWFLFFFSINIIVQHNKLKSHSHQAPKF